MEESKEQLDQPPPANITVQGDATEHLIWLEERASEVLRFLQMDESDVSVLVVDDIEMSRLHKQHSGVNGTTDVLTFDHGSEGIFDTCGHCNLCRCCNERSETSWTQS